MTDPYSSPVHELVGGIPEVMGPWQLDVLIAHGLQPDSRVVDLGCGTLRGGLHIIGYLEPGMYAGFDPLQDLLDRGHSLLAEANLTHKDPQLGTLGELDSIDPRSADFVLSQSVLNHLDADQIEDTVARVAAMLATGGIWIATARFSETVESVEPGEPHPSRPNEHLNSVMGVSWFQRVLERHGMVFELSDDHLHPRGLQVFAVRRVDGDIARAVEKQLRPLIAYDTSPDGRDHGAAVEWLEDVLVDEGFNVRRFGDATAPLLVAHRPALGGEGRVVIYDHYDVDHVEGDWSVPPFALTKVDGRWFGLGVADNKGALAARLAALATMTTAPEIYWLIQGEEECGSEALRAYLNEHGLPDADWYFDENGKTDDRGSQRLLAFRKAEGGPQPLHGSEQDFLRRATRVSGNASHFEVRPLNKEFVPGGCPFQQHLPKGARYIGLGTNDKNTRIHAPDESIPVRGAVAHVLQIRSLLVSIAGAE